MFIFIAVLQTVLAGVFGWFVPSIADALKKSYSGVWKIYLLWVIYISALFTSNYLGWASRERANYDTSKYEVVYNTENVDNQIDTLSFKIVRK